MKRIRKRGLAAPATAVAAVLVLWATAAAPGSSGGPLTRGVGAATGRLSLAGRSLDATPRGLPGVPATGSYGFFLELHAAPTGRVYDATLARGKSAARAAAESQLATVRTAQNSVIAALPGGSHVLYRTHAVLPGVAVYTRVTNLPALQRITGVAHVYPIAPKTPSLSYSTVLVRAPQVWSTYGDRGENSTIAIIDTGVDYTHADFGGSGNPADYATAKANDTSTPTYPDPAKIAGGYDFAGDAYDAGTPADATPVPDPNPLDCDGHGTHTSGIAAGYGENPDGSTFTGDYATLPTTSSAYQALFRIGPGMAPEAKLYEYKVFGCGGSTNLVGAAIDRAADPNGDGDTSDHVDVISMSLGSDYGSPQDADAMASNAASELGISVVAAAGNAGDVYDVGGSPGNAQRVIDVAASVDAYSQIDTLHATVNGTLKTYGAQRSVDYKAWGATDLGGTVVELTDASNLDGCDPISQNVAGKVVFLEWTDDDTTRPAPTTSPRPAASA
jgi:Subtilase family